VTVPVGVPIPFATTLVGSTAADATVAVKVTDCPASEGLALLTSVVVVEEKTAFTVWVSGADVLGACMALPL
jgi:hypothetical protein